MADLFVINQTIDADILFLKSLRKSQLMNMSVIKTRRSNDRSPIQTSRQTAIRIRAPCFQALQSKESKIPVGIAVAWQRLVTSTSTNPTAASVMTTKAESGGSGSDHPQLLHFPAKQKVAAAAATHNHHHHNHSSSISSSTSNNNSNNPIYANRNNSGDNNNTSSSSSAGGSSSNPSANKNGYGESSDISVGSSVNSGNNIIGRPLSACGEPSGGGGIVPFCPSAASPLSRPLPSSSVPPNLGFPTASSYQYPHRGPYIDYPYGIAGNSGSGGFAMPSSPHHHHHHHQQHLVGNGHFWGLENPSVPLLSPGMPSPGASEYLQLSMQQQMQLHQQHLLATTRQSSLPLSSSSPYNPYLPFLYPHHQDPSLAAKSPYYDHFFHQNELIRHHQQQQQHQQSQLLLSQHQQQQQHEAFQHHQQQQQQLQHHSHQTDTGNSNNSGITNSVNSSNNNGSSGRTSSTNNSNVSVSNVGGFDLLANNGSQHHRAIPMQVASSRTSIPLLSPSPTGGLRTSTPTSTLVIIIIINTAAATTTATIVTSCNTSTTPHQDHSSSQSASASWPAASPSTGVELSSSYSSSYSSASSPSPSFLLLHHQQQHPHLFTSSSAALSPKSLTSSTPSPVTVHDFNSGLNVVIGNSNGNSGSSSGNNNLSSAMLTARKCATPSPISLTPRGLLSPFGSPFSPSPVPTHPGNNNNNNNKDLVWKEDAAKIKPIPTKAHAGGSVDELRTMIANGHGATMEKGGGSLTTTPTSSPSL
ncbi:hypothetical protein Ocin01_13115, partial [Orchesella cincta]